MNKILVVLTVLVFTGLSSSLALANEGWYFGVGAGDAEVDVSLSDIDDGSLTSGSVDDSDTGTKLFAGFQFSENVAVEGAFVDLGEVSADATSNGSSFLYVAGPVNAEAEADGINIAVVGIWPVGEKVDVIGKLGFFMWDVDASISNGGIKLSDDDDGTDAMFGIGGQFRVGKKVGIRVEFERFTEVAETDIDLLSVSVLFAPERK